MSHDIAPPDEYEGCPRCDSEDLETWVEEIEHGRPLNEFSRGAEAPRYRTKPVRFFACNNCDWHRP